MSHNIYKVTTDATGGALYLLFKDGKIKEALFQFDPPLSKGYENALNNVFPHDEEIVQCMKNRGFKAVELKPRTVADKLAMFCMSFRAHRGTAYTAKKMEKANIADVTVSPKLMDAYFTCNDFPLSYGKSISDYVRHYNFIRDIAENGQPKKNGLPNVYDREYERGLEPEKLSAYRQHLHGLGWRFVQGTWRSPESLKQP